MYGKVFEDLFCSTLMDCGGDTAYVFIAMIVLSDESGIIKHTPESLARVICKDVESVKHAVTQLSLPDPDSNLSAHSGRRIVPLSEVNEDETRGWLVVNKEHYRDKKDLEEIRTKTRERVRKFRERNAVKRCVTLGNAEKRHTDTDTDTDTDKTKPLASSDTSLSAVALIPLVGKKEWSVDLKFLRELEAAYPDVDGPGTLREIRAWCLANPTKRKTERGVRRFLNRWFERTQNNG